MDKVIVLGAIDRHNYGDLLFPILLTEYLKKELKETFDAIPIEYYGSIQSDLSKYGAIKTEHSNHLYKTKVTDKTVVVVVGGAVLFASWINVLSYLKSDSFFKLVSIANKIIPSDIMENLLAKAFNFQLKKPFIIPRNVFASAKPRITYNAAGSSQIASLTKNSKKYLSETLNDSDYISVRDQKSFDNLKTIGVTKKFFLSPDSAIIMSDYFPIPVLENMIEQKTLKLIKDDLKGDYFGFQIGLKFVDENINLIANQLDAIYLEHKIPTLLIPIGNAPGHNNDIALNKILSTMKTNSAKILESSNVYDIMYGIASSRVFAGTSLHGNITAVSFNVESIVLTSKVIKLNDFVNTWLEKDEINIVEFENLAVVFSKLIPKNFTGYKNYATLKNKVYENYKRLFQTN